MAASNYTSLHLFLPKAAHQLVVQLAEEHGIKPGKMAVRLIEEALERGWVRPPDRSTTGNNGRKNQHGAPAASIPRKQKHYG